MCSAEQRLEGAGRLEFCGKQFEEGCEVSVASIFKEAVSSVQLVGMPMRTTGAGFRGEGGG
jgi:hypothetical protein